MQPILFTLFIVITLIITYQDFTDRAVMWILFPMLAAIGIIFHLSENQASLQYYFLNTGINCLFIIIQVGVLWIYFLSTKRSPSALIKNIGPGDILFFFASACFFTVEQYLLYNVLCFACTLAVVFIYKRIRTLNTIPLAGVQSLFLLLIKFFDYAGKNN